MSSVGLIFHNSLKVTILGLGSGDISRLISLLVVALFSNFIEVVYIRAVVLVVATLLEYCQNFASCHERWPAGLLVIRANHHALNALS